MAQWINVFWNNTFINPMPLALLCRNSRAVELAEPGLMTGWLAGRRNAGKFQIKFIVDQIFQLFPVFNTVRALLE